MTTLNTKIRNHWTATATLLLAFVGLGVVQQNIKTPSLFAAETASPLEVAELRCEHLVNPLGLDLPSPRLSWQLVASHEQLRGQAQKSYHVLVASDQQTLAKNVGDLWDSGLVTSDRSILVPYQGKPLNSHQDCWWKVQIVDAKGQKSAWSKPAYWSMGIVSNDDWHKAEWIGLDDASEEGIDIVDVKQSQWLCYPEGNGAHDSPVATRYFRRQLTLPADRKVKRAICFFAGDDQCVFYVNGAQVGVGHGHPGLIGVNITQNLHAGSNDLAAAATNMKADVPNNPGGWIGAVRIEFEQGEPLIIHSDKEWKCNKSGAEGWASADTNNAEWVAAFEIGKAGILPWGMPWKDKWFSENRRLAGRYLRREFETTQGKRIQKATAHVCGLGFFDLHVNGTRIGDQLMNPALTGYDKRVMVVTHDVTEQLKSGKNAIGIVLSNGRFFAPRSQVPMPMVTYGYPKALVKLRVQYNDGTEQTIVSDQQWKVTANGPLRASSEFDGEEYDARLSMPGWDSPSFDDTKWQGAQKVAAPGGEIESQMIEGIRVIDRLKPIKIVQPKPGIWMVDFGQAFYGVVEVKGVGPAGTKVSMRTSFNILPNGLLNYINDRSALNTDVYTMVGNGQETWHARFRGNATRWVQIEGFPGTPTEENFAGLVTHTDHEQVGHFECSNPLVNRIYRNASWGTRMQNRSVPMEPDRDERMPWSGHPAKTSESEGWIFNVARFYSHFLKNYRLHQADDGSLQEILPPYWQFNSKDILWPSVSTIIPDWYYNFYGDEQPLKDNYEMMKRFVEYHRVTNLKPDDTLDLCIYGDWVDTASIGDNSRNFGATSRPLMGTAYFYHNCRIIERAAKLLGHTQDAATYGQLADKVSVAFNKRFFDATTNRYESGTQCSYVLPLAFGLVPEANRKAVIANLVDDIMVKHNGHTSVGLIGMQWQMQVLTDIGHPEVAYKIATRTERPSWGYMIDHGATTVWERWDTDTQDGGMNGESQKILSGNFEAWCFQTVGGINYDPAKPGFKHIVLRPRIMGDLEWANASHVSPYGKISSKWKLKDGKLQWDITVPANTTATVYVPTNNAASLLESGRVVNAATPGITTVQPEADSVVIELGSGTYHFTAVRK